MSGLEAVFNILLLSARLPEQDGEGGLLGPRGRSEPAQVCSARREAEAGLNDKGERGRRSNTFKSGTRSNKAPTADEMTCKAAVSACYIIKTRFI